MRNKNLSIQPAHTEAQCRAGLKGRQVRQSAYGLRELRGL